MILETCLALVVLHSSPILTQSPPGATGKKEAKRTAAVTIEFSPRKLAISERSPEDELKAILAARATLKTTRPIKYRTVTLPAGSYQVSIITSGREASGPNLYFLISPPESGQPADDSSRSSPEEKKSSENDARPENAPAPTTKNEAEGKNPGGKKAPPGPQGEASDQPQQKGDGKKSPERIRAIFRLKQAPSTLDEIRFSVRQSSRGDQFAITVQAGSSLGKANIRFAK